MPKFRTLDDIDVSGKRVLLRADLNVPVKNGVVTDATRIERLAPTIAALIAKGAKVTRNQNPISSADGMNVMQTNQPMSKTVRIRK